MPCAMRHQLRVELVQSELRTPVVCVTYYNIDRQISKLPFFPTAGYPGAKPAGGISTSAARVVDVARCGEFEELHCDRA